jgi:hypothetical protein
LIEMRYALHGVIPDGLVFRVSSISRDTAGAFRDQGEFTADLLAVMTPEARRRISGL